MISKFKKNKSISTLLAIILIISVGLIGLTGCNQSADNDTAALPTPASDTENKDNPASTTPPTSESTKEVFYGEWVINQVLAYGSAGTYSSEDATSLLGKSLNFSADKASNFGEQPSDITKVAVNPVYRKTVISNSDFVTTYRMTFDKLGIQADSISQITVSDSKGNGCTFLTKDDNTLIIFGGDTYFELVRKTP